MFSFLLVAAFSADAQSCSKSASASKACCASKKTAAVSTTDATVASLADVAMANDENITKRTCEISGASSYYQKSVCATSGTVSWEEVQFDAEAKQFTKVASASMEKDMETGEKVEGKACCAKGASGKACAGKGTKEAGCKKAGA